MAMSDEELEKFRESIRRLSEEVDPLTEEIKRNQRAQDNLVGSIKKNNDATDKEILARLKSNAALLKGEQVYDQQMKALGLTKNALGEFERTTVKLTNEQKKRLAEEQSITDRQKARDDISAKYHSMMTDKTGTLLKGLSAFGEGLNKTVFDSTRGQSKYGEALDSAGNKVQELGKLFGPFGKSVAYATGGLLKLAGAAMKQQEGLNKAYETLSEIGAVDVSGIEGMFKNLQNAGFTVKELDKFGNILKVAGPNLSTLGTTVADGAKKFSETLLAVKNTGVEKELRMLGFTSESMAKTFADYQGMMGRQGLLQGKSTQEVAKRSSEYAKTLDELAKLTGQSRDELQKNMDAAANDMRVRSRMRELEQSGDEKSIKIAEQMRNATAMAAEFNEDTASGMKEMMATGGKVMTDAGARLMISTGNKAAEIFKQLDEGSIDANEAMRRVSVAMKDQYDNHLRLGKVLGDNMSELGLYTKSLDASNKFAEKTPEAIEKMRREQELQAKGALDNQRAAEVQRQITERNMEQAKDKLTNMVGKVMVGAFETLQKVINGFAKRLAELLAKFGGPDFTDLFKSAEDYKEDLQKTSSELEKTNKQIEQINSARDRYLLKEKEYLDKNNQIQQLESQISNETNQERKKALLEELNQKQKERALVKAEADQARTDFKRSENTRKKLEEDKLQLERKQAEQKIKLEQAGGLIGTEKESSEVKKIREEQEQILIERNKLNELINDKTKIIYEQTLKSLGMTEDDLKNTEKRTAFENKYAEAKKGYLDRRADLDKRLEQSEKDIALANQKEADMAKARASTPSGIMGGPGAGPKSSMGGYLQKIAQIESTGYAGARSDKSSAAGLFQFTIPTWKQMTKEMGKDYSLEDRFDPKKSAEVAAFFTAKQSGQLSKALGREPNDTELYMAHFLGAGGAIKFLSAMSQSPGAPATEGATSKQIEANRPIFYEEAGKGKLRSLQEVYALMNRKVESAGQTIQSGKAGPDISKIQTAQSGGLMSGPESGYPVLLHGKELVIPMPNTSDLSNVLESVSKTALSTGATPAATAQSSNGLVDQFMSLQNDLMNMIANKLDQLDSRLAKSNDIQENILTYSAG